MKITGKKELVSAVQEYYEQQQEMKEMREEIEEAYGYFQLVEDHDTLKKDIESYMVKSDTARAEATGLKATLVRSKNTYWDADKLRSLLPKGLYTRVCEISVSSRRIEELVKQGKIDDKVIAPALIEVDKKPYVRFYDKDSKEADEVSELEGKLA